ncbi:hypothetical protein RRG08_054868 [Elysia crispata]|uniref:Uncharacterized protein n=1 Tax=Elysia crispata TaxID=231223 RepID=A0AAE1DSQ5_9GAST|nr:hypothetical protein RRG08_054868 [Elysia crispata]
MTCVSPNEPLPGWDTIGSPSSSRLNRRRRPHSGYRSLQQSKSDIAAFLPQVTKYDRIEQLQRSTQKQLVFSQAGKPFLKMTSGNSKRK